MFPQKSMSKKSTEVPGQLFGYSLQTTRMLQRLLGANSGDIVSVEVFEDIGVESVGGFKVAEQTKTALDRNPISNKAEDLWKTFSNWLNAVVSKKIDEKNASFELYITTKKDGEIVNSFDRARDNKEAQKAYEDARSKVVKTGGGKRTRAETFAGNFFSGDKKTSALEIIKRFTLVKGTGVLADELRQAFAKAFVPKDLEDFCIRYALGWVKMEAESLLEKQLPCAISYDAFHIEMTSYLEKLSRKPVLTSTAEPPTTNDVEVLKLAPFVQQLNLVDCDSADVLESINDYFLATSDRVDWVTRGWVNSSSFAELESALQRNWRNEQKILNLEDKASDDKIKGKKLFYKCNSHRTRVEGMDPPDHFIPGCYHALADSLLIGWHKDYPTLIKPKK